jgi:polysaccharide biosynthesis/export protein
MLRRQLASLLVATTTGLALLCVFNLGFAGSQKTVKQQPVAAEKGEQDELPVRRDTGPGAAKRRAEIDKLIAAFDLKPAPSPAIPDDPPPHEGAMITLPIIIEPPDLVIIEVLEALPGRPISGERLIKPDGTISLGFYGDVYVKGLTLKQLKVAIIKQLRPSLADVTLGLESQEETEPAPDPAGGAKDPFPRDENPKVNSANTADGPPWKVVAPDASQVVFVDVTAYNSRHYYIQGDVLTTGKLPWTGNETVLDALQYAGGLLPSAEPRDIRLVRPARAGKPAKVYKVDLAAIQEKGDVMANYQIFPGDRLIVGRNDVVKKTVEIDRLNGPIQSITSSMLQEAFLLRALQFATADDREGLLKELVDFWAKETSRPGGVQFDGQTLREAFLRKMKLTPAPLQTAPAPR